MSEICMRCNNQSLMFANMPMFPTFCYNCDPTPEGVLLIEVTEEE
jgi:hypothetical protein